MHQMRLEAQDEYPHAPGPELNFNESMYFNVFDPQRRVGGFFRIGNRVNEGHAEMTVCLYLPDGSVGFMYRRPELAANDRFEAGGLAFAVREPLRTFSLRYSGKVVRLRDPRALEDPAAAFKNCPQEPCEVALEYRGVSPLHGGEPLADDVQTMYGRSFSLGHFNQHMAATGTLHVGGERWPIAGWGWRDHSWGPRYWQNIAWYRLLLANFDEDFGFMLLKITDPDRTTRRVGVILRDGAYEALEDLDLFTEWSEDGYHQRIRCNARTAQGLYEITGNVRTLAPLRNRRSIEGRTLHTRIAEGLTEWHCRGRTGWGLAEYLDQLVDDRPAGVPN